MDLFPLFNSVRISFLSTVLVFFTGLCFAYYISKLPRIAKGILDCLLTLPLVLPPTVVGFVLLMAMSPQSALGGYLMNNFGIRMVMVWPASVIATAAVGFPLMYRAVRSSFEDFDEDIADCARCLGIGKTRIFWRIRVPYCKNGLIAGSVLVFARSLGEYGASSMVSGYTPGRTATISTTVYQLWQANDEALAMKWILVNLAISFVMLIFINVFEKKNKRAR